MAVLRTAYLWAVDRGCCLRSPYQVHHMGGGGLDAGRQDLLLILTKDKSEHRIVGPPVSVVVKFENCRTVVWLSCGFSQIWGVKNSHVNLLIGNIIPLSLSLSLYNYSLYWMYRPGENWGMSCTGGCYSATVQGELAPYASPSPLMAW